MSKFGPKTTAALAMCLPRYNGKLAKPIATTHFDGARALGILMIVLGGLFLAGIAVIGWMLFLQFGQIPYGAP